MKTHRIFRSADGQNADRAWDWLTALSPMLLQLPPVLRNSCLLIYLIIAS